MLQSKSNCPCRDFLFARAVSLVGGFFCAFKPGDRLLARGAFLVPVIFEAASTAARYSDVNDGAGTRQAPSPLFLREIKYRCRLRNISSYFDRFVTRLVQHVLSHNSSECAQSLNGKIILAI